MRSLPPPRILIAIAVTVVAVGALVLSAVLGGGDEVTRETPDDRPEDTSTSAAPTTVAEVAGTSVVVAPDWYQKGSSRYSDREPAMTITTLATTTTEDTPEDFGGDGTAGSGSGTGGGSDG